MAWVVFYSVLLLIFFGASVYSAVFAAHSSEVLKVVTGSVTLLTALAQALAKANLSFYLFTQRIWLFFHRNQTSIWRFSLRIDGDLGEGAIAKMKESVKHRLFQWDASVLASTQRTLRLKVDKTIHLLIEFDPADQAEDMLDHLLIRSDELEVPYGSAGEKIDRCIVPLMRAIRDEWPLASHSSIFEVEFKQKNPFFTFFVAHLDSKQITNFNLVFRPLSLSRNCSDQVRVTENTLLVETETLEDFASLSKAFLLLTSDVASVAKIR